MQEVFIDEVSAEKLLSDDYIQSLISDNEMKISFLFRSLFENTKTLRDVIVKLLSQLEIPAVWQNRMMLIVDELNNNAIEYGSLQGDINQLRISFSHTPETVSLELEVEDSGKGEFAKKAYEMLELQEKKLTQGFENHKGIRGRGLFMIIFKLVDELYFRDAQQGGLIVGVRKLLQKEKKAE